jgi:hypothetical protein
MILSPARVQDACAHVSNGGLYMTFHRVSEPVTGGLPHYKLNRPSGKLVKVKQ